MLPGLTIAQAAAPHDTLVSVIVAVLAGGAILFPSLALLFRLVLGGHLDHAAPTPDLAATTSAITSALAPGLLARSAAAGLIAGFGLLTVADAGWAHAIGVFCLIAFVVLGFGAMAPVKLADH